jgi:hypothetical protein
MVTDVGKSALKGLHADAVRNLDFYVRPAMGLEGSGHLELLRSEL